MSNIQSIFRCLQLPNSASNQGLCIAIDIVSLDPSLIYNSLLIYRSQHFHLHKVQDNGLESYNLDLCDDFPLSILTILIKKCYADDDTHFPFYHTEGLTMPVCPIIGDTKFESFG